MEIPWAKPEFLGNERNYVDKALTSTWISDGSFVRRFENDLSRIMGIPYSVSTSNGTTAIHLAYLALNIGRGDEIIVPGFGFLAAANIALHVGAKPVFVDIIDNNFCINPDKIENAISDRTKAIVPIHTYGNVCDMKRIMDIASSRKIPVIEDTAEAPFSQYKNEYAGTIGDLGCFSFQATKTITTGEGGLVATNNESLYEKMCLYRNHGMLKKRYWHEVPGHNFRLTNVQAAIGCAQLEKLELIIRERRRIYAQYRKHLNHVRGFRLQSFSPDVKPVPWTFAVYLDPEVFPQGRDRVMEQLNQTGIETRPGFYASSLLTIYKKHTVPLAENMSRHVICLPTYISLQNGQIQTICEEIKKLRLN